MKQLKDILQQHSKAYPLMKVQDFVKLIYQNEFGPGHMIVDEKKSLHRLIEEWKMVSKESTTVPYEEIGNGLIRINLSGIHKEQLKGINRLFVKAGEKVKGEVKGFEEKLLIFYKMCESGALPLDSKEVSNYLEAYRLEGYPAVSHTELFRNQYRPHYRIVEKQFLPYLSLISELELLYEKKQRLILAIDGRCGSGKTTLASSLATIYDANIIHMDEFFLPKVMRTESRLAESGGNIHYERFLKEVITPLKANQDFSYQSFSCRKMDYDEIRKIALKPLQIIEGTYSMRDEFIDTYDYKVFIQISPENQEERLKRREGPAKWQVFKEKWIPLEEGYFNGEAISKKCNMILE